MSVVSMLKSRDLYEFIQGKYPQDEFTRFSDGTYRSSCPIHGGTNESSFAVFPDNSWYCFSCNAGGNIIDYLMEREGLTYSAAVHELCQEYSIDLSQDKAFEEQQSIAQKYESWCKTYEKDVGKCVEYLKQKRGLTDETIKRFRLGWSDRSHAITIPMFDANSREICAYGYRFFEGKAKYKNTKNIPGVFTKGEYLYNLDKCLGLMRKQKRLFVCEGHFDSIAGIQMGYPTVAYCGISLSKNHVELIRQYSSKLDGFQVVIIPDNDGKASKFVTRARELFQKHYPQASVKVLEITGELKDTNDILLAGKDFKDFPLHDIDIYCAREIIKEHPDDIQAQQKKIEGYAKSITNPLTKADLAEYLSETWGKSLDVVKEFLRVSDVNTEDELMNDLSDIEGCFRAFDESLDEEEITFGYPTLDANVAMRRSWVTIVGGYSFSGKCVDEDSLVKTEVGYKKIKDIEKGDRVVTFSETRNVLEFGTVMQKLDTGIKRGYKVKTRKGREVVVSEDHPFLTHSGWKKVKEGLSIGEQIATPNKLMNNGNLVLPVEEVEFLALMIADGYCGKGPSYTKEDNEMVEIMRNSCKFYGTDIRKGTGYTWGIIKPSTYGINDIAILSKNHDGLDKVQYELERLGVRVNRPSKRSVFDSPIAQDVAAILTAIMHPFDEAKVKRALLTRLLNFQLSQLMALEQRPEGLSQFIEDFDYIREMWFNTGFLSAWQYALNLFKAWSNLVASQSRDNERSVVNLRHLTELLSQHSEHFQGPQALYHWYLRQIQAPSEREWELERKLSNEAGVQLMTIHQSKGLEFKIVFLLGADKDFREMNKTLNFSTQQLPDPVTGQPEMQRVIAVNDKHLLDDVAIQQHNARAEAEQHRLWYVALTRASHRVYAMLQDQAGKSTTGLAFWRGHADQVFQHPHSADEAVLSECPIALKRTQDQQLPGIMPCIAPDACQHIVLILIGVLKFIHQN